MKDRPPLRFHSFSDDRVYRYSLWREWDCDSLTGCSDDLPNVSEYLMFVGLNPSTADETNDDATLRRCIALAKRLGLGALCMTNLFAFRAREPKVMKGAADPIGPDNDSHLDRLAHHAGRIIVGWGNDGNFLRRDKAVAKLLLSTGRRIECLFQNKDGSPAHPLYLPKTLHPIQFNL